jgi:hypothetical protein
MSVSSRREGGFQLRAKVQMMDAPVVELPLVVIELEDALAVARPQVFARLYLSGELLVARQELARAHVARREVTTHPERPERAEPKARRRASN